MKKMSKRLIALLLAAVMVMGLSITTFASTNTTHQVTIYLQRASRNSDGEVTSITPLNGGEAVTVTVNHGDSYKTAIEKACDDEDGILSEDEWSGNYLQSLTIGRLVLTNNGSYPSANEYIGESWMYYTGNMPESIDDYPYDLLSQKIVTSDCSFTLSFENMIYTW